MTCDTRCINHDVSGRGSAFHDVQERRDPITVARSINIEKSQFYRLVASAVDVEFEYDMKHLKDETKRPMIAGVGKKIDFDRLSTFIRDTLVQEFAGPSDVGI